MARRASAFDRSNFTKMATIRIFGKCTPYGEPHLERLRLGCATGKQKTSWGFGEGVKGQDHVFPYPGSVLDERRPRAAAGLRLEAGCDLAEHRRQGRGGCFGRHRHRL